MVLNTPIGSGSDKCLIPDVPELLSVNHQQTQTLTNLIDGAM
jgi:hypothetical protein